MSRLARETLFWPGEGGAPRVSSPTSAAVVGGGIAGVAAATILAERGVDVTLYEREGRLGGRAGAFPLRLSTGESVSMERGFHAFFRQYFNLRRLFCRIDPELAFLAPLDDYPILGPGGRRQSFRDLPKETPWQLVELLRRSPYLRLKDLVRTNARAALEMLRFDMDRTPEAHDGTSAAEYLDSLRFPPEARRMLFDVFAHSFFHPEAELSAAELLMMFHAYFTGNPEGLLFDVASRPLSKAIWEPYAAWLGAHGVKLATETAVRRIERGEAGWTLEHAGASTRADLVVLALDVAALRELVAASPALARLDTSALGVTRPFAVWRLWLDRPVAADRAAFVGTTGVGLLDNISVYDRFQDESREWAGRHGGSVVELHAYAVPPEADEARIRRDLLAALHELYPETRESHAVDECFLVRQDCPAFPPGSWATRSRVDVGVAGLALAGDFVAVPMPCALMERAAVSGILAANTLLAPLGVAAEPIESLPRRGWLAPSARPRTWVVGRALPNATAVDRRPDWEQASPRWVARALAHAEALPAGGWYVLDASSSFAARPRATIVCGRHLVVWRDGDSIRAAPDECPHLGAALSDGCVRDGKLVCPWHGLALGAEAHGAWRPLAMHDDGLLAWVRLDDGEAASEAPPLAERPRDAIAAVVRLEAACDPRDVIANRLDPWHGPHLHAGAFASLRVIDQREDEITVRVAYRLVGPLAIEVDARFHCVDRRTIVMTIVAGEGTGSIVETHATPIAPGRTAVVEATLATSDRPGFAHARRISALVRPAMRFAARRLWKDDAPYAERLFELRMRAASRAAEREDLTGVLRFATGFSRGAAGTARNADRRPGRGASRLNY